MENIELFQRYLDVCNRALEANRDRFPFKQILGQAQNSEDQRTIEVSIIDDHPSETLTLKVDGKKLVGDIHGKCANCQCDGAWRVNKSYLENVVSSPQTYIENPAKIDWEWLVDRGQSS